MSAQPRVHAAAKRLALSLAVLLSACGDSTTTAPVEREFLDGTLDNPQIALVVNTLAKSVRLMQLGDLAQTRDIALGPSSAITPVGISVRGRQVAVPLGNAASVALIDPWEERIQRFFLFGSGNATGSAFPDDNTLLVGNLIDDLVGRVRLDQVSDEIEQTVAVAPAPFAIVPDGNRAYVISANLDEAFAPLGDGVVTALDSESLDVIGTVSTGGPNASDAALGPSGLLYVVNTGDFVSPGSLAIVDPGTLSLLDVVDGFGVGPGRIRVDAQGLAYISGVFFGTLVWDTKTREFLRGPPDPVCAPLPSGDCRGAFDARPDGAGRLYQVFFGSDAEGLPPQVFVYERQTFTLSDSVPAGQGPVALEIATFRGP
jgi:hypothetical protein